MVTGTQPRILLVDDDRSLLLFLRVNLENDGFEVITSADGSHVLEIVRDRPPDLAIVDLMMPGIHGFEVSERLQRYLDIPVIFLTGVDEVKEKVAGIQRFAEDYVTKPFEYPELLARISRILRRTAGTTGNKASCVVVDDGLTVDFGRHQVLTPRGTENLSPTESRLLFHLINNAGTTLSSASLIARVWSYNDEGGTESLRVNIHRLRRKIEKDPKVPEYLVTVKDIGYKFKPWR